VRRPTIRGGRWLKLGLVVVLVLTVLIPSAASGVGTFDDDDGNTHEANIEWLASKGITVGCNAPAFNNYCPDKPVTRGQMATFMRRLTNVIAPIVWSQGDSDAGGTLVTTAARTTVSSIAIDAPVDGYLVVSGNVWIDPQDTGSIDLLVRLDGSDVAPTGFVVAEAVPDAPSLNDEFSMAYTITYPVTAGQHVVSQALQGLGSYFYNAANLTVVFNPTGSWSAHTAEAPAAGGDKG
jgi:hypothetical protein